MPQSGLILGLLVALMLTGGCDSSSANKGRVDAPDGSVGDFGTGGWMTGAGGAASGAGGLGGAAAALGGASAGGSLMGGAGSTLPPPSDDSCARFKMTYTAGSCTGSCPNVACSCSPYPVSLVGCNAKRGCLASVQSVHCVASKCTSGATGANCASAGDCVSSYCAGDSGAQAVGQCTTGAPGQPCDGATDFQSGYCGKPGAGAVLVGS